jgi:hypothetical protein
MPGFAPQVLMREATKQRGSLLLVPEQGMRLQPVVREGVTQLDPQKAGHHAERRARVPHFADTVEAGT